MYVRKQSTKQQNTKSHEENVGKSSNYNEIRIWPIPYKIL